MREPAFEFSDRLLIWFDKHGRKNLPWQNTITDYSTWISEIMLQQTQVKTVIPYFERFMALFPDVETLAHATEDDVLHSWTGLGYYSRARNLYKTAKIITYELNGRFPTSVESLEALPGIGRSTAGAILSIAMNQRAPILDGNVKRVLTRHFGIKGYPGKALVNRKLWQLASELTPHERIRDYTQAIMDLGATLCTRSSPDCEGCPFRETCVAFMTDTVDNFPERKASRKLPVRKIFMIILTNQEGQVLLEKRPSSGIWGGLWSLPESDEKDLDEHIEQLTRKVRAINEPRTMPEFRHTFSHFHLDITPIQIKSFYEEETIGFPGENRLWFHPKTGPRIGLSAPVTKLLNINLDSPKATGSP